MSTITFGTGIYIYKWQQSHLARVYVYKWQQSHLTRVYVYKCQQSHLARVYVYKPQQNEQQIKHQPITNKIGIKTNIVFTR